MTKQMIIPALAAWNKVFTEFNIAVVNQTRGEQFSDRFSVGKAARQPIPSLEQTNNREGNFDRCASNKNTRWIIWRRTINLVTRSRLRFAKRSAGRCTKKKVNWNVATFTNDDEKLKKKNIEIYKWNEIPFNTRRKAFLPRCRIHQTRSLAFLFPASTTHCSNPLAGWTSERKLIIFRLARCGRAITETTTRNKFRNRKNGNEFRMEENCRTGRII